MDWLRWHIWPHKAVILTAVIVAAGLATLWIVSPSDRLLRANNGFGPDWECTPVPGGEPICVKKLQH